MTYTFSKADIGKKCRFRDGHGYAVIVNVLDEPDCYGNQLVIRDPSGKFSFCRIDGTCFWLGKNYDLLPPRIEADDLLWEIKNYLNSNGSTFTTDLKVSEKICAYFAQQAEEKK